MNDLDRDLLVRAFASSPMRQGVVEVLPDDLRLLAANAACRDLFLVPAEDAAHGATSPMDVSAVVGRRLSEITLAPGLLDAWLESCLDAWRQHASATFRFIDTTTQPPRRLAVTVAPVAGEADPRRWCCAFHVDDAPASGPSDAAAAAARGPLADDGHFRHMADAAPAMLWTSDDHSERDYFNRTWLEFTGRRLRDALGEGWLDAVHPDDRHACRDTWQEAFLGREAYRQEYRLQRADGAFRWVLDSGVPRFRSDGRFLGFVGSCVDITRRRQTEERLRLSERWYRELIEGTDNLVIQIDGEGRLSFVNARSREVWGAEPEECVGFPFLDFVQPEERDEVRRRMAGLTDLGGDQALHIEMRMRGKRGGARTLLWTMNPHLDAEKTLVSTSAIAQDVTERRLAEDERRRLDEHLREAQRLESLGVLAGGIAHDFNNLLMTILGNASLLLSEVGEDGSMHADLKQIETAALRAAELTQQMLAYSGKGRFLVEPTDLSALIQEIRPLIASSATSSSSIELRLADHLPLVEADAGQIRQVVLNLITNAAEALDRGGTIQLLTERRTLRPADLPGLVLGHSLSPGEMVALEVKDDGIGMAEDVLSRIFDPFYTTKFTGRGLGLAAVLGIVRGHAGALEVTSRPGQGSTFTVYLPPAARKERPKSGEWPRPKPEDLATEGTILVVDDDDDVRDMATRMLERLGFRVLEADGGEHALELYRQHQDDVVLVLLDLTMPRMDGEATLRALRRIRTDVQVILSSGYGEPEDEFYDDPALAPAGFLQKPYRQTDLILKIDQVLDLRH